MNNALTQDDLADLLAVSNGARSPNGERRYLRASELDDNGAKLLGLGLVEVRTPAVYGIEGSVRLGVSDAGLDELHERGL
jgi:hypothetical protein